VALATNPFVVLSYVGGPAILTNGTSVLLMSTSNRFARAIDRSRVLVARLAKAEGDVTKTSDYLEIFDVRRRVHLIATALSFLYLAASMFGLATLLSIAGAVLAETLGGPVVAAVIIGAVGCGVVGFSGFVIAGIVLVVESRLAMRSLVRESDEVLRNLRGAIGALPPKAKE